MVQDLVVFCSLLSVLAVVVSAVLFQAACARLPVSKLTWKGDSPAEKLFRRKRSAYACGAWIAVTIAAISSGWVAFDAYNGLTYVAERTELVSRAVQSAAAFIPKSAPASPALADAGSSPEPIPEATSPRVLWPVRNFCRPNRAMRQCRFRLDPKAESRDAKIATPTKPAFCALDTAMGG